MMMQKAPDAPVSRNLHSSSSSSFAARTANSFASSIRPSSRSRVAFSRIRITSTPGRRVLNEVERFWCEGSLCVSSSQTVTPSVARREISCTSLSYSPSWRSMRSSRSFSYCTTRGNWGRRRETICMTRLPDVKPPVKQTSEREALYHYQPPVK